MIIVIAALLLLIVLANPVACELLFALIRLVVMLALWIAGIVMVIAAIGFIFDQVQ